MLFQSILASAAYLALQINDFLDSVVRHLPLSCNQLLSLFGAAVEEARVDFALLILQGYVAGQDVAVFHVLGHVRMPSSMVQN